MGIMQKCDGAKEKDAFAEAIKTGVVAKDTGGKKTKDRKVRKSYER